jgi:hypothetical protein
VKVSRASNDVSFLDDRPFEGHKVAVSTHATLLGTDSLSVSISRDALRSAICFLRYH